MSLYYEEEEDWELPVVLGESSVDDSITYEMPSAEELLELRAKELECQEELQRLRELEEGDEEAHKTLAAELSTLLRLPQARRPPAAELWAALAPHVPGAPTGDEAPMLQAGLLEAQMPQIVQALAAGVKSAARWSDADMLGSCALLTVAVLMENSPNRRKAVRTLHALLDRYANREQLMAVAYMMVTAFPAASAARLELIDQVCSGSCSGGDRIAYILNSTAMLDLLGAGARADGAPATFCAPSFMQVARAAASWRHCEAAAQQRCIQLAGRLLTETLGGGTPDTEPEERALLLEHLRPDPLMDSDTPQKDRLKVLVEASKLRLLFHEEL
ncbi:unnamed protein product [Spodoptera littoralis]|uniref:Uncharacterized protein n=1 Tax=Spodoptera littoralis TaxID=7109 RepID=A0A9P0I7X9_SPOLI|nr:unnamed protein product [Spodoptera littoralis]CAH1641349.1 unnamed protein product [Spodoptera littoralis]